MLDVLAVYLEEPWVCVSEGTVYASEVVCLRALKMEVLRWSLHALVHGVSYIMGAFSALSKVGHAARLSHAWCMWTRSYVQSIYRDT